MLYLNGAAIICLLLGVGAHAADFTSSSSPTAGYSRDPASDTEAKQLGWNKAANIALNLAFTSSEGVVGQSDGSSQTYGLNFKGSLTRVGESDEWRNILSLLEATTKTPNISNYLKSSDELKVETIYLHALSNRPEYGPYVRGLAAAPIFIGQDLRETPQVYNVTRADKSNQQISGTSLRLTDGLRPLETRESLGAYIKALKRDNIALEFRLGFAAKQIQARGEFAVQGTNSAGQIQVDELENVNQAGIEAAMGLKGKIDDKSAYEAGLETMTPFINNKDSNDSRNPVELTNYDGFVKLTSNITKWAAFAYDYKLKIEPQLLPGAQQIHMLTLNVNYNLF